MALALALGFAQASMADEAGEAKCNDSRSISRDVSETYSTQTCYDPYLRQRAEGSAVDRAERAARERLEKFDGECARLPGGHIVELDSRPEARSNIDWHYTTETYCYPTPRGDRCVTRRVPTYQYCDIYAKSTVKHLCRCD